MPIFYGGVTLLELEKEIKKINYIKEIEWHTEKNYANKANDCVEILYFEKGEGEIIIGGTKTPVVAGSIYIINSNISYSYSTASPAPFSLIKIRFDAKFIGENVSNEHFISDCYEYEFSQDLSSDYKRFCFVSSYRFIFFSNGGREYEEYVKNIYYEYVNKKEGYISFIRKQLEILLINVFRDFVFGKPSKLTIEQKTIVENFISKIKSEGYLFDNYDKILKDTGYCKLHFNRIFKEYSGVTIAQYIKEKRIEVAKKLLTDTDKTVEEVCVEVGYKDTANFYQIFKSATGISPRQFCKRNKRI